MDLSGYLYKCSAGETFDTIALAIYGNEKYAAELMAANPELVRVAMFVGGEVLRFPVVEIAEDESDVTSAPAVAPWK